MLAIQYGLYHIATALIEEGADVNAKDNEQRSVMLYAFWYGHGNYGHGNIVQVLKQNGAHLGIKNPDTEI